MFEHLCGTSKSVTRLSDGDVEDELLDAELPHGVLGLLAGFNLHHFVSTSESQVRRISTILVVADGLLIGLILPWSKYSPNF